jgi:hypothetical protein
MDAKPVFLVLHFWLSFVCAKLPQRRVTYGLCGVSCYCRRFLVVSFVHYLISSIRCQVLFHRKDKCHRVHKSKVEPHKLCMILSAAPEACNPT